MKIYSFLFSVLLAAAASAIPAGQSDEVTVASCIKNSGLTADEIRSAIVPGAALNDGQKSFVKCLLTADNMIDAAENFQYDSLNAAHSVHSENHPEAAAKLKVIIEACKGLKGAITVKGCIEANGGTIF